MLVDDDPDFRFVVKDILRDIPATYIEATNGRDALLLLTGDSGIDLIVSDVDMPVMSGIDLRRAQQADSRLQSIPFVLLSGETVSLRSKGLSGQVHFVHKLDAREFLRTIADALLGGQRTC